jgi:hypothetical protein
MPAAPPDYRVPSTLEHSSGEIERAFALAPAERKRSRVVWMIPLFVAFALGSAVVVKLAVDESDTTKRAAAAVDDNTNTATAPEPKPERSSGGETPPELDADVAERAMPMPTTRFIEVSLPKGARGIAVRDDGGEHEVPGKIEIELGSPLEISIVADGFEDQTVVLDDATTDQITVELKAKSTKKTKPTPSKQTRRTKRDTRPAKTKPDEPPKKKNGKLKTFDKLDW